MFRKLLTLMVAVLLPQSVHADYRGWYVEGMFGRAYGDHDLSYQSFSQHIDLYDFTVKGNVYGLATGYRWQLGHSDWYAGAEVAIKAGSVSGSQQFVVPGMGVADVRFKSDTFATVSASLGYSPNPDWLVYGQVGVAGADMSLTALANNSLQTLSFQDRASGWVLGEFVALGVVKQFQSNWYIGTELQWYQFSGTADLGTKSPYPGQLKAGTDHTAIMVTLGYQF